MSQSTEQPIEGVLKNGDRIRIQQGARTIPDLVGRFGTIVELFRVPLDSCLAHLDDDTERMREWFFYRDEFVVSNT